MGYKILYGKTKKQEGHIFRRITLTAAFFALFVFLLQSFWPEGAELLRSLLIPQALETFVSELENGDGLGEAVTAFCQELTDGQ